MADRARVDARPRERHGQVVYCVNMTLYGWLGLAKVLREEFVRMYLDHDVLEELADGLGVGLELPERGQLDLEQTLKSNFFFG